MNGLCHIYKTISIESKKGKKFESTRNEQAEFSNESFRPVTEVVIL